MINNKKSYIPIIILYVILSSNIVGQNEVCFDIESNPNPNDAALGIFDKYVNVLDCIHIYAVESISDEKVLHAASIAAELLDNDEDGDIDDPNIESALSSVLTVMPIFNSEFSNAIDDFFDSYEGCAGAILFRDEIDPSQPGHWGDDASVEEILHTINACGHVEQYPELYSLEPNSSYLTDAMDIARGGQWLSIPSSYPDEAWYHYDDWTCDYECMAMEYLYWCIVTDMGILADIETCEGIANEWEPCTPDLFESTDTLMFELVNNIENKLPQYAPDGNYCPDNVKIVEQNKKRGINDFFVYPNPFNSFIKIKLNLIKFNNININIYGVKGDLIKSLFTSKKSVEISEIRWDGTDNNFENVSSGLYLCVVEISGNRHTEKIVLLK
tara:strand:+ start:147 stop:1301 length:1155 start_codon:yes stop_codon:yes gene_type:complete